MNMDRLLTPAVQEFYWEQPWLQNLYTRFARFRAKGKDRADRPYEALLEFCNATRRVRNLSLRAESASLLRKFVERTFSKHPPSTLADNLFVEAFKKGPWSDEARSKLRKMTIEDRSRLKGNLLVLKVPSGSERGVLLIQYSFAIEQFLLNFDLRNISQRYAVVLEPSWATVPQPFWFLMSCQSTPVVCEMISNADCEFMRQTGALTSPLNIGAQDWVDPDVFRPLPGYEKEFDVVMVANFARFKRHYVLFEAMARMRPRRLKVAIVGRTYERTRAEFDDEMRKYGVLEDCTVFQGLSASGVNEVLNRSKINVLLSKAEGGNRGIMEGFAADVPAVVYRHIIGPRHQDINASTGMFANDHELHHVLLQALENLNTFKPREWFLQHTGFQRSSRCLNDHLRDLSVSRGESWTQDIVQKANRHESQYVSSADAERMQPAYDDLSKMLVEF